MPVAYVGEHRYVKLGLEEGVTIYILSHSTSTKQNPSGLDAERFQGGAADYKVTWRSGQLPGVLQAWLPLSFQPFRAFHPCAHGPLPWRAFRQACQLPAWLPQL